MTGFRASDRQRARGLAARGAAIIADIDTVDAARNGIGSLAEGKVVTVG